MTQIAATAPGMVALENRGRKRTQYMLSKRHDLNLK